MECQNISSLTFLSDHLESYPPSFLTFDSPCYISVPIFVFNNVTSLPLLLITALASTGALNELIPEGQLLAEVVSRGRVYILINALVGNLTRFAFGPCKYLFSRNLNHLIAHEISIPLSWH